jgi:hypothetical protein
MPRNIKQQTDTGRQLSRNVFANRHRTVYSNNFLHYFNECSNFDNNLGIMKGKPSSQNGCVPYPREGAFHPRVANTITMSGSQVVDRAAKRRRVSKPPLHSEGN